MHTAFGLKIKHLNNLITKKIYALFTDDEYPFISHNPLEYARLVLEGKIEIRANTQDDMIQKNSAVCWVLLVYCPSFMFSLFAAKDYDMIKTER